MYTILTLEAEELFPFIPDSNYSKQKKKFLVGGEWYKANMSSSRLILFKQNPTCVCCGITGSKFLLQRSDTRPQETPHFNFFAVDDEGELILMTKDHVLPSSKGGRDAFKNYQTMCTTCNNIKGNDPIPNEDLTFIRNAYDGLLKSGMKHKEVFHNIEDMKAALLARVDNGLGSD